MNYLDDYETYEDNIFTFVSLSDLNQPYSCSAWANLAPNGSGDVIHDTGYGIFNLFNSSNGFPSFAFIDHNMTVHFKGNSAGTYSTKLKIQDMLDACIEDGLCGNADMDGDGFMSDNDNCPNDYNPDQSDVDGDLIGDVCDECNNMSGDVNDDMTIDVLDIVNVVNVIFSGGSGTECQLSDADMDGNSTVNVLDVIQIINLVLGTAREEVVNGSTYVTYSIENNDLILEFNSDVPMSGIELAFSNDFLINIENNNANLYEATALDTDIQRYVAFSMSNSSFVNNKVTLKDGALIEIEDINMIVSSEQGTQINTVWDVAEIKTFKLSGLQPNPFNPVTQIEYDVYKSGVMQLAVYNLLGQKVSVLHNGFVNQGSHMYTWDASNLSSGVYYVSLVMDGHSETMKAMLVK